MMISSGSMLRELSEVFFEKLTNQKMYHALWTSEYCQNVEHSPYHRN